MDVISLVCLYILIGGSVAYIGNNGAIKYRNRPWNCIEVIICITTWPVIFLLAIDAIVRHFKRKKKERDWHV